MMIAKDGTLEDNEDEESDEESDESCSPVAVMADSQQRSANINTKKKKKKQTNEEGEEWGESQQKKDIIAAFLDRDSGIHELTATQIFEDYAADHGWVKLNATNNIRRLKKQYDGKEGPFSEKQVTKTEPFTTRKTKSKAYTLLLKLHMMSEQSGVESMTIEQLHQSEACFRQYPLKDFKRHNADVRRLAGRRRQSSSKIRPSCSVT
eukprot:scaffold16827_cov129-Skeletonema_marinoi.AAC.2